MSHPELNLEKERLKEVINWIFVKHCQKNPNSVPFNKVWDYFGGADVYTANILRLRECQQWNLWREIESNPYFGRIDLIEEDSKLETFYIGEMGFKTPHTYVIDWRAPLASLYYQKIVNGSQLNTYNSPSGRRQCKLKLKRHLVIKNKEIIDIQDEIDRHKDSVALSNPEITNKVLIQRIKKRGDPELQKIVSTIQPDQNFLIRAPSGKALVINGVAGSGKTSIGFHRLAFLIYPESNTGIDPNKVIIFGPNRLFLSYVHKLLPSLNVNNITQVTFYDWALERMRLKNKSQLGQWKNDLEITDRSLIVFLDPQTSREKRIKTWKRSRIKGSIKFSQLLEKYIHSQKHLLLERLTDIKACDIGELRLSINFTEDEIQKVIQHSLIGNQSLRSTIDSQIQALISQVPQKYIEAFRKAMNSSKSIIQIKNLYNPRLSSTIQEKEIDEAKAKLKNQIKEFWSIDDTLKMYKQLLSNREKLEKHQKSGLSAVEIDMIASDLIEPNVIDLEDIPGLFYLHILVNGIGSLSFDHVVIDEAQDFSPLQFKVLKLFNPTNSFTILGDIAQGILSHRGLKEWEELSKIFGGNLDIQVVQQSYRSTNEITKFNNELLRSFRKEKSLPAIPLGRNGKLPKIVKNVNLSALLHTFCEDLNSLLSSGYSNIGIIVKTPRDFSILVSTLRKIQNLRFSVIESSHSDFLYNGGIVIVPVAFSKGLEFEAVMIFDVSESNYHSNTEYDGRLLYVAATRPLHELYLYSTGPLTGFLESAVKKQLCIFY